MKRYGLIGHPLSHSFSKKYFTSKFEQEGRSDCTYDLFDLENCDEMVGLIQTDDQLIGLNVTIPFKEEVIAFLDDIDDTANRIGAINTIKIEGPSKKLIGYNTDYYGFKNSIKPFLAIQHEKALILGTGGASKAVQHVLKDLNIGFNLVSRTPKNNHEMSYDDLNQYAIKHHQLIINTTPIGMFPNETMAPKLPYEHLTEQHFLCDLVYNPSETLFLQEGKKRGCLTLNGLSMLHLQAEKAWEIWNS